MPSHLICAVFPRRRQSLEGIGQLGAYLRDRRVRIDPKSCGLPTGRRRTTGLRREEVAQRANISPVWYTCFEQGRGGPPSGEVLGRIADALMLTEVERQHLFMLGLGRLPDVQYRQSDSVTQRLQHVLDRLNPAPAFMRTATWDVVGWNRAATVIFGPFDELPLHDRNTLRFFFLNPGVSEAQSDWESVARWVVGTFRVDVLRAGAPAEAKPLVDELCRLSPDFRRLWHSNDVQGAYGERVKSIPHTVLGAFSFEYSVFAVDGHTDLNMIVCNPATSADESRIAALLKRIPG